MSALSVPPFPEFPPDLCMIPDPSTMPTSSDFPTFPNFSPDSAAMPAFPDFSPDLPDVPAFPDFTPDSPAMPAFPESQPSSPNFGELNDENDNIPAFPDCPELSGPSLDPVAIFPEPDSVGMLPIPDSIGIPPFPNPDSVGISNLDWADPPKDYSPAMRVFPGPPGLVGIPVFPDSTKSAKKVVVQSPSITGLAEIPTLDEVLQGKGKWKQMYPKVLARSSPNEGKPPAKKKKVASTSLVLALNPTPKKQNTGRAQSSALAISPRAAPKRDRGQDFHRLGDERKIDPNYFKVCFVSLLCILGLDVRCSVADPCRTEKRT